MQKSLENFLEMYVILVSNNVFGYWVKTKKTIFCLSTTEAVIS